MSNHIDARRNRAAKKLFRIVDSIRRIRGTRCRRLKKDNHDLTELHGRLEVCAGQLEALARELQRPHAEQRTLPI